MTPFDGVDVASESVSNATPPLGRMNFGPLRNMAPARLSACLARHRLSTGNDRNLEIRIDESGGMWISVQGADVTGYFLESGSYGLEACEEAVAAFFQEAGLTGAMLRVCGQYSPAPAVEVSSSANYMLSDGGLVGQSQRLRKAGDQHSCIAASGAPVLVSSQEDRQSYQSQALPDCASKKRRP